MTCVEKPLISAFLLRVSAVPPAAPAFLPLDSLLLPLARREMEVLADAVAAAPGHAELLAHMLNRREAVDSSQIEGTHTQFDELLLHELEVGTPDAATDADADQTLKYLRAYTLGATQMRTQGRLGLDTGLIRAMHSQLMSGNPRAVPGEFRGVQNFIGGLKMEHARYIPPPPSQVPGLMADLDRLIRHEPDPDPTSVVLMDRAISRMHSDLVSPYSPLVARVRNDR
jgi:Fic family protein